MKKSKKIILSVLCILLCAVITVPTVVFKVRGNLGSTETENGFAAKLSENVKPAQDGEIRIMSSNLLVGYKSWGGLPVKPRAAMYISLIQTVEPDVIGVQEMCDGWYCALRNNLPKG